MSLSPVLRPSLRPLPPGRRTAGLAAGHGTRAWCLALLCAALVACGGQDGAPSPTDDAGTDLVDTGTADAPDGNEIGPDGVDDTGPDAPDATDAADTPDSADTADTADRDTFFDPDVPNGADTGTPPPVGPLGLLAIDPATGPTEGGTPIFVLGYGFTVDTEVRINGRLVDNTDLVDSETILARTPPNPVGVYDVKVSNSSEEALLVQGFTYFARLAPGHVEPATGPTRGGMPVTLTGAGFTDDTLVSVGGRLGIAIDVVSSTRIDFVLPPGVAGDADVRVTNEHGSEVLARAFTYYDEPAIDAIVPAAGGVAGDYLVELRGSGFTPDLTVRFGPVAASIEYVDASLVRVRVPAGAPGPVDVSASSARGGDTLLSGFRYVADPSGSLDVQAVVPSSGSASGGYLATIAGPGVHRATGASFGTAAATIVQASPGALVVTVPPGTGLVGVTVDTADESATLEGAFEYRPVLAVSGVVPSRGQVAGGETVRVLGEGFDADVRLSFGPILATAVTVVSPTELSAVTPPGTIGPVDVGVRDRTRSAILRDGFTYFEDPAVASFVPSRGAIAGNTYVVVRGRGFYGDVRVLFGDVEAPVVEVIDAATLAVRTPPAAAAGRVAVTVIVDGIEVRTGKNFVYYDPFTPAGGWWGDAIDGSVNVTVIDAMDGSRIEAAFVTLHVRITDSQFTCRTNPNGQCTISDPAIRGRQTISASAADYSAVTVNRVDAENVVIALSPTVPPTPGTPPGYIPPTIRGTLEGLDKITDPGAGERIIGVIRTTTPGVGASNPPGTGFAQVSWTSGSAPIPYEMASREGELAVVALCGVFNEGTGAFTPLYMGIRRGLAVRGEGSVYEVPLNCNIHLTQTLTVKFRNPPIYPGGPQISQAFPYLDFGGEGAIDLLRVIEGRTEIISNGRFAPLSHSALAGVHYDIIGQTVTTDGGLPFSVVYARDIWSPGARIDFPPSVPPAELRYPTPGTTVVERRFEWTVATSVRPDFYYAYIQDLSQEVTFWEVWLPGDETGFNLPYFPPGEETVALPSGPLVLIVLAVDAITFDYDAFEFNDFAAYNWRAYSAAGWVFVNP